MIPGSIEVNVDYPAYPGTLEHTLVLGGCVEMQIQRIARQVDMYHIRGMNRDDSVELRSLMRYLNALFLDRNVQVLCLVENGRADIVLALRGVGVAYGFVLDCVLKLIVLEVRRGHFGGHIHAAHNYE